MTERDDPTQNLVRAVRDGSGIFAALLLVEEHGADPRPAADEARQQGHDRLADALDDAADRLAEPVGGARTP